MQVGQDVTFRTGTEVIEVQMGDGTRFSQPTPVSEGPPWPRLR